MIKVNVGWCGGGFAFDWVYLRDFTSNFHKNWSGGNSLVVKDCFVLLGCGCSAVIASKTMMRDQDELGDGLHELGHFLHFAMILWSKNWELGRVTCIPDGRGVGGVRLVMPVVPCTR